MLFRIKRNIIEIKRDMSFLDFLKSKKVDTPLGEGFIIEEPINSRNPYIEEGTPQVYRYAAQVIWQHNTRQNSSIVWSSLDLLYNLVQRNGRELIDLSDENIGTVGHAFAIRALCYSNGDRDFNSVAAENAVYCLGREFLLTKDMRCACLLFGLFYGPEDILLDKLITARIEEYQNAGYPIGRVFGGRDPYRDPSLEVFRDEASSFRLAIARYLLDYFYDVTNKHFKAAQDFLPFCPSESTLESFFQDFSEYNFTDNSNESKEEGYVVVGRNQFKRVYNDCERLLKKYSL